MSATGQAIPKKMGLAALSPEARKAIVAKGIATRRGRAADRLSPQERFWSRVNKSSGIWKIVDGQISECWAWMAGLIGPGYGAFWFEGKQRRAHIVSYVWENGPIPDGLELDHLCRTRHCVRPDHLEAVTPKINMARGTGIGVINAQKTTCPNGHPYDYNDGGSRRCAACRKANWTAYRLANLAQFAEYQRKHRERVRAAKQTAATQKETV